jgi:hypothetical protein
MRAPFVSDNESSSRRWAKSLLLAVAFLVWWVGTCWLARDVRPWAIELTKILVALGLLGAYALPWSCAIIWARSPRRMVFRAIGSTLVFSVLLMIVELPAVFGLADYAELWSRVTGEWGGPSTSFVNDWDVGFLHPPHSKWSGRPRSDMAVYWNLPIRRAEPMSFTTDKRGFRNQIDRDEVDIVLLGDSYIEGAYVSDDETCAAVLERATGLRVANQAIAGFGTLQELEVLIHHGIPLRPRLAAWFFFEGNDLYNDVDFEGSLPLLREHLPYKASGWKWNDFWSRSATRTVYRGLRRTLDPVAPNSVDTCGLFRDATGVPHQMYFNSYGSLHYDQYEQECFERTKAAFLRGRDLCRENNIQLVLFYIPMKFRVYGEFCVFPAESPCVDWKPWNLIDYFREFCHEASIEFVDLTLSMRAAAQSGTLLYVPEDSHWNSAGQEFVAERLREQWLRYFAPAP